MAWLIAQRAKAVATTASMHEGKHESAEAEIADAIQHPACHRRFVGRVQLQASLRHQVNQLLLTQRWLGEFHRRWQVEKR